MKTRDIFIVHPKTNEQVTALKAFMKALKIKFEVSKEGEYNPDFIAKIEESKRQHKSGQYISVKKDEIDTFLGLK